MYFIPAVGLAMIWIQARWYANLATLNFNYQEPSEVKVYQEVYEYLTLYPLTTSDHFCGSAGSERCNVMACSYNILQ